MTQSPQGREIPFVSVVVPVYNDAGRIGKCIEALLAQTYPRHKYEILVVDNGSTDETRTVVGQYPCTLLIEHSIQSSYAARNAGIKSATGGVIAFTDSDCIPREDWLERGVTNLLGVSNCGLVGGRINVFFRNAVRPNAVELYDSITGFNQKEDVERHHFGSTANVFTFKSVLDGVGFFNDNLKSGGDNEWGRRVFSCGYAQIYADDVVVAHPARYSFRQLQRRHARLIGGCYEQYWQNSYWAHIKESIGSIRNIVGLIAGTVFRRNHTVKLKGIKRKLQFISVYTFIQVIGALERMRLLLGGSPQR